MAKALKEAKLNTSWIQPNEPWDSAMHEFVAKILDPSPKNKFLPQFIPVAEEVARLGAINSLTQTVLKFTSPGVPDIYQGNEIWNYSLVDPDNRRPVDYDLRRKLLCGLKNATARELLGNWPDGRIKLMITQRLLHLRRAHPEFFRRANYVPVESTGMFSESVVAFMRENEGQFLLVLATRLSSRIGFPATAERWKDTAVNIPDSLPMEKMREIFSERAITSNDRLLNLSDAMAELPFAVYTNLL